MFRIYIDFPLSNNYKIKLLAHYHHRRRCGVTAPVSVIGVMDISDMDQTQLISFGEEDDLTDELDSDGVKKPVSFLKVLLQCGLQETSHPLYEGDNIIGRSAESCHVRISSKSLSKEHACIQIINDVHMIFDKASTNKTRRGKLFLQPEVRYELKDKDEIYFADVKCIYLIPDKLQASPLKLSKQSDILVENTPDREKMTARQALAVSESESDEEEENIEKKIQETLLCEDSDLDRNSDQDVYFAATQPYLNTMNKRVDDDETSNLSSTFDLEYKVETEMVIKLNLPPVDISSMEDSPMLNKKDIHMNENSVCHSDTNSAGSHLFSLSTLVCDKDIVNVQSPSSGLIEHSCTSQNIPSETVVISETLNFRNDSSKSSCTQDNMYNEQLKERIVGKEDNETIFLSCADEAPLSENETNQTDQMKTICRSPARRGSSKIINPASGCTNVKNNESSNVEESVLIIGKASTQIIKTSSLDFTDATTSLNIVKKTVTYAAAEPCFGGDTQEYFDLAHNSTQEFVNPAGNNFIDKVCSADEPTQAYAVDFSSSSSVETNPDETQKYEIFDHNTTEELDDKNQTEKCSNNLADDQVLEENVSDDDSDIEAESVLKSDVVDCQDHLLSGESAADDKTFLLDVIKYNKDDNGLLETMEPNKVQVEETSCSSPSKLHETKVTFCSFGISPGQSPYKSVLARRKGPHSPASKQVAFAESTVEIQLEESNLDSDSRQKKKCHGRNKSKSDSTGEVPEEKTKMVITSDGTETNENHELNIQLENLEGGSNESAQESNSTLSEESQKSVEMCAPRTRKGRKSNIQCHSEVEKVNNKRMKLDQESEDRLRGRSRKSVLKNSVAVTCDKTVNGASSVDLEIPKIEREKINESINKPSEPAETIESINKPSNIDVSEPNKNTDVETEDLGNVKKKSLADLKLPNIEETIPTSSRRKRISTHPVYLKDFETDKPKMRKLATVDQTLETDRPLMRKLAAGDQTISDEKSAEISSSTKSRKSSRVSRLSDIAIQPLSTDSNQPAKQSQSIVQLAKTMSPKQSQNILQPTNTALDKQSQDFIKPVSTNSPRNGRILRRQPKALNENTDRGKITGKVQKGKKKLVQDGEKDSEKHQLHCGHERVDVNTSIDKIKEQTNLDTSESKTQRLEVFKKSSAVELVDRETESQVKTKVVKRKAKISQPDPVQSTSKVRATHLEEDQTDKNKNKTEIDKKLSSPSLRRSSSAQKPKVMFTGLIDEPGEKIVKDLGGEIASVIQDCTHLVTDKIRRTVKFLSGLSKGIPIVSPMWLENSKQVGTFLDGHKYLVSDPSIEKQYKFTLHSSIAKASSAPLFKGYKIHVTKSVRPSPEQMEEILLCAGAEYLKSIPNKVTDNSIVISCPEDKKLCLLAIKIGIPVVGAEFVLTGILRQEIDIKSYSIFTEDNLPAIKGKRKSQ